MPAGCDGPRAEDPVSEGDETRHQLVGKEWAERKMPPGFLAVNGSGGNVLRDATIPELPNHYRGKVRDNYDLPDGRRIIIASDRLSAFDRILTAVPFKGEALTQIARFWFEKTADICPNHVIDYPDPNVVVCRRLNIMPVEIVVRDRAGAYADGARQGAPQAIQVADRWHLLRNGSDALRGVLDHHHRHLDKAAQIAAAVTAEPAVNDNTLDAASAQDTELPVTKAEQRSLDAQQRRDARFEEAVRLREQGMTIRGIARALGVGRKTVRRWLRAGHAPTWRHADRGRSILDPFHAYLETRWAAGCRNGTGLWREIRERGFTGQSGIVRQWATRRRRQDPAVDRAPPAKPPKRTTRGKRVWERTVWWASAMACARPTLSARSPTRPASPAARSARSSSSSASHWSRCPAT